ncbi:MAG: UDP-N-acetylmuramoyl-L-alanine--D-glutamate ligase [Alphaproteobacteria bacterium]
MQEIKTFSKTLEGKSVLIYGMGKTGKPLVQALNKAGVKLVIGDDNPQSLKEFDEHQNIQRLNIETQDFSELAFLVLSPGVPLTHPKPHKVVEKARQSALEIISDIELFFRIYPDFKTIGVTGTNGKSTTVSLISHILSKAGIDNALAGNIGTAMFDLDMEGDNPLKWIVLEMSSYQIDLCPHFRPDISLILNVTPDHIDRHGTIENYARIKARIFEPKEKANAGAAVICSDDEYTKQILQEIKKENARKVIEVSTHKLQSCDVYVQDNKLIDSREDTQNIGDLSTLRVLKGKHNAQNTACAYAAARQTGLPPQTIWEAIKTFPGLNHRQYLVRTINGVHYINDSKATNAASSAMALECYDNIFWIVGGRQKQTGLQGLEKYAARIKQAFLIGESSDEFAKWFDRIGIEYRFCGTMDQALEHAHKAAQLQQKEIKDKTVVLLSPACASFDQYASFEERGAHFAKLVNALEEGV